VAQRLSALSGRPRPPHEPRKRWLRGSCAKPQVDIDGDAGDPILLEIDCLEGWRHLPIIRTRRTFASSVRATGVLVAFPCVIVEQIVRDDADCYRVSVGGVAVFTWVLV
jgi:hypothetical protein